MSEYRLTWDLLDNMGWGGRCEKHGRAMRTGLGVLGVGTMWCERTDETPWDDLDEIRCDECWKEPDPGVVGEGIFHRDADGKIRVEWNPPNTGRTLCTRAVIEALFAEINGMPGGRVTRPVIPDAPTTPQEGS